MLPKVRQKLLARQAPVKVDDSPDRGANDLRLGPHNTVRPVKHEKALLFIPPRSQTPTIIRCLASSSANERPISFLLDESEIEVRRIMECWRKRIILFQRGDR